MLDFGHCHTKYLKMDAFLKFTIKNYLYRGIFMVKIAKLIELLALLLISGKNII